MAPGQRALLVPLLCMGHCPAPDPKDDSNATLPPLHRCNPDPAQRAIMALAQTGRLPPPAPAASTPASAAATPAPAGADPVIAKVGPDQIHASDLADAMQGLPEQLRGMPPSMIYPMLLDQLVDRDVIVQAARKQGLQEDPAVQRSITRATNTVLQNALLTREIAPKLTDAAIQARYQKDYANKPGEEEVRASHILVADEAKAKDIIAQLDKGADFADLAKKNSTDPSAAQNNGELGWFKKGDMLPEFSDAAFALKPGQITQTPVHTRFGWHGSRSRRPAPRRRPSSRGARRDPPGADPGRRGQSAGVCQGRHPDREVQPGRHADDHPAGDAGTPPGGAPGAAPAAQ